MRESEREMGRMEEKSACVRKRHFGLSALRGESRAVHFILFDSDSFRMDPPFSPHETRTVRVVQFSEESPL